MFMSAVESFSLLFENPPYDFEVGENRNGRMEYLFLEHTYRWLKPGGILVLVIPGDRLSTCAEILAVHFRDKVIYRLSEPESIRYKQVVVFGVRRTRREREQLKDWDVQRAKTKLLAFTRTYDDLPVLPDEADKEFAVPPSGPAQLVYRGMPLDTVEDLLPASAAYRQAGRILFAPEVRATGRPLTPLHGGHIGPIRNIEDFSCKLFRKRLFSRWRHSIGKMFYRMRSLPRSLLPLSNQWTDGVSIISSLPALALCHLPEGANLGFP